MFKKQCPIGRDSAKKQKAVDVIIDSLKKSIPLNTQLLMNTNHISSDLAESKEGTNKANEKMDSLVKYQLMMMAPSSIKTITSRCVCKYLPG